MLLEWGKAYGLTALTSNQALIYAEAALVVWLFRKVRGAGKENDAYLAIAKELFMAFRDGSLRYPISPAISPMEVVGGSPGGTVV